MNASRIFVSAVLSLALVAGCKRTGNSDLPAVHQTATTTSEPSPDSQPESSPASMPADDADIGPGPWEYSHSIGGPGSEPGQFQEPVGLVVTPEGDLIVSDAGNNRIQKLSGTGESLAVFAESIGRPMHLNWSAEGRLVVAVFLEDRIRTFEEATTAEDFGGEWLDAPAAAVQAKNGHYYVADFYHHQFHVVSADGKRLKSIGEKGEADGQFTYPTDVALEPGGNVWIADAYAHRLQKFDADGTHLKTIGGWGTTPGKFKIATGIDVGPDGFLYVADFDNGRVQVLDPGGTPTAILDSVSDGDQSMKRPTDVVATKDWLYVVDHGHHQIDVWRRR